MPEILLKPGERLVQIGDTPSPASNGMSDVARRFAKNGIRSAGVGFGMADYSVHEDHQPKLIVRRSNARPSAPVPHESRRIFPNT